MAYYQATPQGSEHGLRSFDFSVEGMVSGRVLPATTVTIQSSSQDQYSVTMPRLRSTSMASSQGPKERKRTVGLVSLVVLTFYTVSGGPFGIEDVVRAGGPFYALVGFSLFLIWAVPEAMITMELSTALPEASGSVAWVEEAFGSWWAFQKGYLSWLSGVADNALYPILFLDCLLELLVDKHGITSPLGSDAEGMRWYLIAAITVVLTYLNYRGLDVVSEVAIFICLFSLLPFVIFCVLGIPHVDPARWLVAPAGGIWGVDWRLLLNTFFWNINYWESASSFSGDVIEPEKNMPRGIGVAVLLVFLSTFLPILIGTGASSEHYSDWSDGHFVHLASTIVGPWLSYWMMLGGTMTTIGMFTAEMSSDAWVVAGMAERGILPKWLGRRNQFGTPTFGILLSASGVLFLCSLRFSDVVEVLNLLFCFGQIIEFCAFLELRRSRPNMPRPYRIPLSTTGCAVLVVMPFAFIFIICGFSSWKTLLISTSLAMLGVPMRWLLTKHKAECPEAFY